MAEDGLIKATVTLIIEEVGLTALAEVKNA